jgi:radical SAM superfamily enzyme YgiQ (UPF0313 family)
MERGAIKKDGAGMVRVALVFPAVYRVGMSNLGFQAVYRAFNSLDFAVAERFFLPSNDDVLEHERTSTPLFSIETSSPLYDFDVIAFSVSFEEDYVNIPAIMRLGRVPLYSKDRPSGPIVIAGGAGPSLNPEPLADFIDAFVIGDGEQAARAIADEILDYKNKREAKESLVSRLSRIEGVYVPSLYAYSFDGPRIAAIKADHAPKVVRAIKNPVGRGCRMAETVVTTPETEFGESVLMEIERGCGRGCRFCAAGFMYLPPRWQDTGDVIDNVKSAATRAKKVGLVGAAVSEHPGLKEIIRASMEAGVEVTLSSLRADCIDAQLLGLLKEAGYKTVTIAPEAATERMRGVINKGFTDEGLIETARMIGRAGFRRLKLYFMIGLPTETDEDAAAVAGLALRMRAAINGTVSVSVNPFVPKPFTPFEWHPFEQTKTIEARLASIKKILLKEKGVELRAYSPKEAFWQALLSRGDRRLGSVIELASVKGWKRALRESGFDAEGAVYGERKRRDMLPWDVIDHGVRKDYLRAEYERALRAKPTPPCEVGRCFRCGVCK